jgi:hypothetical protein
MGATPPPDEASAGAKAAGISNAGESATGSASGGGAAEIGISAGPFRASIGTSGTSMTASVGSAGLTGSFGVSEMRLPQRPRISFLPSLITRSPARSATRFFV